MIDSLLGVNPYLNYYQYGQYNQHSRNLTQTPLEQVRATEHAQAAGKVRNAVVVSRAANPDTPVQPVQAVPRVDNESSGEVAAMLPFLRQGADPAEMAVRMRMKTYDPEKEALEVEKALHDKTVEKRIDDKLFANKPENPVNKSNAVIRELNADSVIPTKTAEEITAKRAENSKRTQAVRENSRRSVATRQSEQAQERFSAVETDNRANRRSQIQNTAPTVAQVEEARENSTPIEKRKPFFAIA